MADRIQIRRDTAANWTSANPTMASGEIGLETDTGKLKIGDGSTAWSSLPYDGAPVSDYDTRSGVTSAFVHGDVDRIRTAGYSAIGDGGGALYKRVGAEPSHAFKVQSADSAWWEGVPEPWGVSAHVFGVAGDDPGDGTGTDDTTALQNALDYAKSNDVELWFHKGKKYRTGTLTVSDMTGLVMRSGGGLSNDADDVASLVFAGTAGTTLLHLDGVIYSTIEGVNFEYGSAAPDAYIKVTNSASTVSVAPDLNNVLIIGNGKTDGSVGVDIGPGETTNDSNMRWGRVETRNIQTGVQFNHSQVVGFNIDYFRAVDCGTALNVIDGGVLHINTWDSTNCNTDIKIRGGGANHGTFIVDNAHAEQSPASGSAVFLDVASTAAGGVTVVLDNPVVTNNYTGTGISVGQAAKVICTGGHIRTDVDLSGTQNDGDAVFLGIGTRMEGAFTTNDWGYYRIDGGSDPNVVNPFGGFTTRSAGAEVIGHVIEKMPAARKQYTTMPLHRPGGATVMRAFPSNANITAIYLVIEAVGSSTVGDQITIRVGGTTTVDIAVIATHLVGARKLGWRVHDLDAGDTGSNGLGSPTALSTFGAEPEVRAVITAGSAANIRTITGHMIVEYALESVRATGLDP